MQSDKPLPPIRDRALAYLTRREHTNLELARKLLHAGYPEDEIKNVLDELSQRGWLSSLRFAENYVTQKQARFGCQKLAYELRQKGVEESTVQQALASAQETEWDRAREIWQKKFAVLPSTLAERAKQTRFLLGRGFEADTIRRLLGHK